MLRTKKPNKESFFLLVQQLRRLVKAWDFPVDFIHVGRDENALADWLTHLPRQLGRSVDALEEGYTLREG